MLTFTEKRNARSFHYGHLKALLGSAFAASTGKVISFYLFGC